ncbi:response regulator transcription factor [Myxococcota bacterium]|nr:response regulator transcription factor [Myxococcota bacterium]
MKILLADDHILVRQCLRICLSTNPSLEVVGEAADGPTAVAMALELVPDVLVVDVSMPGFGGIEVARRVTSALGTKCKVLALSMHGDREFVAEMFRAGAAGYVVKSAAYDELVRALEAITQGNTYVSPAVAGALVDGFVRGPRAAEGSEARLTPREREVLQLVADGLHTKEVADRLGISDKTVHALRARLMRKLDVQSVADLTKYAIRCGLAALD